MSVPLISHTYHTSNTPIKNVTSGVLYTVSGETTEYYLRPLVGNIGIYDISNLGNTIYGFVKGSYNSTFHTFTIEYIEDAVSYHKNIVYYNVIPIPSELIECTVFDKAFLSASMAAFTGDENKSKTCLRKSDLESNNLQFRLNGYVFGEDHYSDNLIVALDDIDPALSKIVGSVFFYLLNGYQTSGGVTLSNSDETVNYIDETLVNGYQYYYSPSSGSNRISRGQNLKLRFSDLFSDGTNSYEYDHYTVLGSYGSASISSPNVHNFLININNVKSNFGIIIYLKQSSLVSLCENDVMALFWSGDNPVLVINNSDERFSGYQWYKNSTPISGATLLYYFDEDLSESTDLYWCRCTLVEGGTIDTCPETILEMGLLKIEYYLNFTATSDATIDNLGLTSVGGEPIKRTERAEDLGSNSYRFVFDNPISEISHSDFQGKNDLTTISIPNSVVNIRNSAFEDCINLTIVEIPNTVINIESKAFYNCSSLVMATLPNSIISIGDWAFKYCSALISINIPNSVTSIGNNVFHGCTNARTLSISSNISDLKNSAFRDCKSITTVNIPNNVTRIGDHTFAGCSALMYVNFTSNSNVTTFESESFDSCLNLMNITIPATTTYLGLNAFNKCDNLSSIKILASTPPTIGINPFGPINIFGDYIGCPIFVPANKVNDYKTDWPIYADKIQAIQS